MATDQLQEPRFWAHPVPPGPFSEIAAIQKFSSSLVVLLPAAAVTRHHVNVAPTTFVIAPNALNVAGVVVEGKFVQLLKHHQLLSSCTLRRPI
uniref:Uncharacterized protein n=1 Tax=Moniliophthora roreri TaxID=221103 RepID=A0A0W0GC49_MONRR